MSLRYPSNHILKGNDMKFKQVIGLFVIVIGLVIFSYSLYAKYRVGEVRKNIEQGSSLFHGNNPVDKQINHALENKIAAYDLPILVGLIGGIVIVIVGVGTVFYRRKRR